jgi:hypothetical protein
MRVSPFVAVRGVWRRADTACRRSQCRAPGRAVLFEARHPIAVNAGFILVLVLSGWWATHARVLVCGLSVAYLCRMVSWRPGGHVRQQFERRLWMATTGPPDGAGNGNGNDNGNDNADGTPSDDGRVAP